MADKKNDSAERLTETPHRLRVMLIDMLYGLVDY